MVVGTLDVELPDYPLGEPRLPPRQRTEDDARLPLTALLSKVLVLLIFALVQNCLILAIGSLVLDFHGMFWLFLPFLMATSLFGILFALFISSCVMSRSSDKNVALNRARSSRA